MSICSRMQSCLGGSVVRFDIGVRRLRHLQDQIVEPPERGNNYPFRECVTRLEEKLVDECDVKTHLPELSHNIVDEHSAQTNVSPPVAMACDSCIRGTSSRVWLWRG